MDRPSDEKANARLIAKAPEMLEVLQLLETAARRYVNKSDKSVDYLEKMLAKARALFKEIER